MKQISKRYPNGVLANDNVNIDLNEGELLAIVGENGAGKSTIMKILYGLEHPTGGEIFIHGKPQVFKNPQSAMKQGIGMVQQNFMLLPPFSIAENVVYGSEPKKMGVFFDRKKAVDEVRQLSGQYGLSIDPTLLIKNCAVGLQQRCEILKVLYQNARIIIFDEPSAVLTPQEVEGLLDTLRQLAGMGKSIILITHKLNEVMAVADRCVIMRGGRHIATLNTGETSIQELSSLMVGRQIVDKEIPKLDKGHCVLKVKNLSLSGPAGQSIVRNCSLNVDSGEIVGIAGVSGNGQTELLHMLVGLLKPDDGEILLNGKEQSGGEVRTIRDAGCAYVPEDRNTMGAALDATLTETLLMAHQYKKELNRHGILNHKSAEESFAALLKEYNVLHSSLKQKSGELSGGNLQKLIVAREISHNAKLLVISEPTRGVDIGAMEFIHNRLIEQRSDGAAILLVSSDLSEILKLSDRIYVMYEGRINGEIMREEANAENVGILMMGGVRHDKAV
ncbi:MAG: ABC transporter ATP-binding protein [Oscillospiraceae bacterium]|nr:ABC transporter ATP-binding protein [Oscillospiraceae bacterium]